MKTFLTLLLCLILCFPLLAASSPTVKTKITCDPVLEFALLTEPTEFPGYTVLEALQVTLDKEYEKVKWRLLVPVDNITIAIVAEEVAMQEGEVTPEGDVLVDFTGFSPGIYAVYFLVSDT